MLISVSMRVGVTQITCALWLTSFDPNGMNDATEGTLPTLIIT